MEEPRIDGFEKEESHVLQLLRRRRQGEREGGFTLIELMVLVIAILIAIAIPTFLGARGRDARSELRNALTAEKTCNADKQAYTQIRSDLTVIEPSLSFDANANQAPVLNSIAYSAMRDVATSGTTYMRNTACDAPSAPTGTFSATGWQ